ncbi:hypothetical protein K2X33_13700 [bacterium]|nr:hypothetical protein [bacterium]
MKHWIWRSFFSLALLAQAALAIDIDRKAPFLGNDEIDVSHYGLRMDFTDLDDSPVKVVAELDVRALSDLNQLKLHTSQQSKIESVVLEGAALPFTIVDGESQSRILKVELPKAVAKGAQFKLTVTLETDAFKRHLWRGHRMRNTESWPYKARNWLPSNDSPQDPASFTIEMHVPAGTVAAANGLLRGENYLQGEPDKENPNRRVFHWTQKQPIPTYGLNVVVGGDGFRPYVGRLSFDENGQRTSQEKAKFSVPVVYYDNGTLPAEIEESLQAYIFFTIHLGKSPYDKLGFVSAPHFSSMESPTLVTLISSQHVVHEIVHDWFGNGIQFRKWNDFWLSEGFTSYMTGFYSEVTTGRNTAKLDKVDKKTLNPAGAEADPLGQFFGTSTPYYKGAAAVADFRRLLAQQLKVETGSEEERARFLSVLSKLYQERKDTPLSSEAFVEWARKDMAEYLATRYQADPQKTAEWVEEWKARWLKL